MYRQGYLDPARVRNQYAYYPSPNFAAMSGFDDVKKLPTAYIEGIKNFKPMQLLGLGGAVCLVAGVVVDDKKKIGKKSKIKAKTALLATGTVSSLISLYYTYQEIS